MKLNRAIDIFRKSNFKIYDYFFLILALFCIIAITVFTFTGSNLYFNSDTATANLLAEEIVRTGELFPSEWYCGQDLWVLFLHIPIAVLTLFMDDMILMHSISCTFFLILTLLSILLFYKNVINDKSWLISIPLLFCGISFEYSIAVFGQFAYLPMLMWMLLSVALLSKSINSEYKIKSKLYFGLLLVLLVLIGLQGMRYIQAIDVPIIGAIILYFIFENYNKKFSSIKTAFFACFKVCVYLGIAVCIGFIGFRYLCTNVHFTAGATSVMYSSIYNCFDNFKTLYNLMLNLFGVSFNVRFFSFDGILNIIKIVAGLLYMIVLPILQIRKYKEESFNIKIFILFSCVHVFEILYLSLFTAFLPVDCSRYLFTAQFLCIILSAHYLYKYILNNSKFIILCISVIMISAVVLPCSIPKMVSFVGYKNGMANMKSLVNYLEQENLSYGYASYWNAGINTVLSNGKVEINGVLINGNISPYYWLVSGQRYKLEAHQGKTFLLLTEEENKTFVSSQNYNDFGQPTDVKRFNQYVIYIYDYNISNGNFSGNWSEKKLTFNYLGLNENCEIQNDKILLKSNGVQYGPNMPLRSGNYKIIIKGLNLDKVNFDCNSNNGFIELNNVVQNENYLEYTISVPEDLNAVEFRNYNFSEELIQINSIEIFVN